MSRSSKPVVRTLKELEIQNALGNDVIMCSRCEDTGTYDYRDIYIYESEDGVPCEDCEMGWPCVWKLWIRNFKRNWEVVTCQEHPDYNGRERPTVLCDACWKIWFESPKRPEYKLIQNKKGDSK